MLQNWSKKISVLFFESFYLKNNTMHLPVFSFYYFSVLKLKANKTLALKREYLDVVSARRPWHPKVFEPNTSWTSTPKNAHFTAQHAKKVFSPKLIFWATRRYTPESKICTAFSAAFPQSGNPAWNGTKSWKATISTSGKQGKMEMGPSIARIVFPEQQSGCPITIWLLWMFLMLMEL